MKITYIHHSCFLVETDSCYYLFDYEKGLLPQMDVTKPIFVLSSHGHHDHYNPEVFSLLENAGMQTVRAILPDDINIHKNVNTLQVSPGKEYFLSPGQKLTTFQSTDLGECEFHLAFETDDYEAAHKLHEEMGCICYENPAMGIYFIIDPDGYWLEILPSNK